MKKQKPKSSASRFSKGGGSALPYVKVKEGEPFERAFRRFTKACEKSGLMAELRRKQRYEKPSEIKKREESASLRKMRKITRWNNR